MTEISDDKTDERRIIIIIHKRQNKNIKVCRQSRADLNYVNPTHAQNRHCNALLPSYPYRIIILMTDGNIGFTARTPMPHRGRTDIAVRRADIQFL